MNITIIVNTSKTTPVTVHVNLSDTVGEAKNKFVNQGGLGKFNQWIYDAEVLEDKQKLADIGISDKDEITANEASRGGLYQIKS